MTTDKHIATKRCNGCGEAKSTAEFYPRGDGTGLRSRCRSCLKRNDSQRARRRALRAERPEFAIRSSIIQRCHNPKNPGFADYGGRGIVVCGRWRVSADAFLTDMGPRPSARHSIERKNNDGPYSPDNCVWATKAEQNRNTRQNVRLTFKGRTLCIAEWAREQGLPEKAIRDRLNLLNWSIERALTEPLHPTKPGRAARCASR